MTKLGKSGICSAARFWVRSGGPPTGRREDAWHPGSSSPPFPRPVAASNRPRTDVIFPRSAAWRVHPGDHPLAPGQDDRILNNPIAPPPCIRKVHNQWWNSGGPPVLDCAARPLRGCRVAKRGGTARRAGLARPPLWGHALAHRCLVGGPRNGPFFHSAWPGLTPPPRRHLDLHWAAALARGCHHVGWARRVTQYVWRLLIRSPDAVHDEAWHGPDVRHGQGGGGPVRRAAFPLGCLISPTLVCGFGLMQTHPTLAREVDCSTAAGQMGFSPHSSPHPPLSKHQQAVSRHWKNTAAIWGVVERECLVLASLRVWYGRGRTHAPRVVCGKEPPGGATEKSLPPPPLYWLVFFKRPSGRAPSLPQLH